MPVPSLAIRISVAAAILTLITPLTVHSLELDRAERQRVIDGVISNLKEHYVDQAMAQKVAEALVEHERAGDYQVIRDGAAFAALLTRQLRDVSRDMHLEVVYTRSVLPENPRGPTPESAARYRAAMERQNCTFERVQILPHNIGYLKLNSFPDPAVCEPTAKAAMASLKHASAVIFDLRKNIGGYPGMVMPIAAYLFDSGIYVQPERKYH